MDLNNSVPRSTWIQRTIEAVFRLFTCFRCGESVEEDVNLSVEETPALEAFINQSSTRPWYC